MKGPPLNVYFQMVKKNSAGHVYLDFRQAPILIGRDPERWRLDAVGNPVLKPLKSCDGPLCYQFDHIIPHSKGGDTIL